MANPVGLAWNALVGRRQLRGAENLLYDTRADGLILPKKGKELVLVTRKVGEEWEGSVNWAAASRCFTIKSEERGAADRAVRHFYGRLSAALSSFRGMGVADALLPDMVQYVWDNFAIEAKQEHDLELGVAKAETRALKLLMNNLTDSQRIEFQKHQYFTVDVKACAKTKTVRDKWPSGAYRIKKSAAYNVEHIETSESFCVVAAEPVPIFDQLLTQKLLLENEPRKFFDKANRSSGVISPQLMYRNQIIVGM